MKRKRKGAKGPPEPAGPPKFGGFHPLAHLKETLAKQGGAEVTAGPAAEGSPPARAPVPAPPPKPPPREPEASPGAEDEALSFHRLMGGTTPLSKGPSERVPLGEAARARIAARKGPSPQELAAAEAEEALEHLRRLVDDGVRFEMSDDGARVEGRRVDLEPKVLRLLRRGQMPIDARLDLHGLTKSQAQEALSQFLRVQRERGERCVLVIHGKGERLPGAGVLRGEISAWLTQSSMRRHVAAFASALDEDGGVGALYVALSRGR